MKKENKLVKVIALVLFVSVIALILVAGTYAKYTSTATGSDTAVVAKWDIKAGPEGNEVSITGDNATVAFNLFDTILDEETFKYITLTKDEYNTYIDYLKNGCTIISTENSANRHTYTNLTPELALELVVYYYRWVLGPTQEAINVQFFNKLASGIDADSKPYDLETEFDKVKFAPPDYIGNYYQMLTLYGAGSRDIYIIGAYTYNAGPSGEATRINKVSTNLIHVNYTVVDINGQLTEDMSYQLLPLNNLKVAS